MIACPGCGANLTFDISSQQMKCGYCGNIYDPYRFDNMEKDADESLVFDVWVYNCPQCGAELMTTDETDATAFCPYCGNTSLLMDKMRKAKRPSYIIPFQITKEECKAAYLREAKKAVFTPSEYKKEELIDSFRGIYMPYWSFRVEQQGEAHIEAESPSSRDGDYVVTDHYDIRAQIDTVYDGITHDASRAFDDEISECLSPFDAHKRVPFTPGFLSGFYADVADEDPGKYEKRVKEYTELETARKLLEDNGVRATTSDLMLKGVSNVQVPSEIGSVYRVFYPVWFMSYRNGNNITYATVNGQTGKVVADFPISTSRFILAALLAALAFFIPLNFFFTLKPGAALAVTTLLLVIGMIMTRRENRKLLDRLEGTQRETILGKISSIQALSTILSVGCVILAAFILVTNPVRNKDYYIPCFIEAAVLFLTIFMNFLVQKKLATRRPPQFNKKGGNDNA